MKEIEVKRPAMIYMEEEKMLVASETGMESIEIQKGEKGVSLKFLDVAEEAYGGTDNWGDAPIILGCKQGSCEGDSVFVDNITIQTESDWCKCEKLPNGAILYTAISDNTAKEQRKVTFKHSTTDDTIKRGIFAGKKAMKEWTVEVIQEAFQEEKQQTKLAEYGEVIDKMNTAISIYGFKPISTKTPKTYRYLCDVYDNAASEFEKDDSWLFDKKTYNRIYDWHGTDRTYYGEAYNSIVAWAIAMCLSELCPTSGVKTNCQTEIFKVAYDLGGGRNVPLTGLEIHANPMISRFAASAIASELHNKYEGQISEMRTELGGKMIPASDWNGLGYQGKDNGEGGMSCLGYLVNTDAIIPSAPGPYANDCDNGRSKPYEQGQSKEQFYISDYTKWWEKENYKVDCAADKFFVDNFEMGAKTPIELWNSYSREKKLQIIHSAAASRCTDDYMFGKKYIKFDGLHMGTRKGKRKDCPYFWFSETTEKPTATNNVFEIAGPFADIEQIFFGVPAVKGYLNSSMDIADNGRLPTFHNNYGRVRPCGGLIRTGSARSPIDGDKLNAIYNIDISCIFASNQTYIDKWANEEGFVTQAPKSYPSGHTTQTWLVALLLGQMNPDTLQKYCDAASQVAEGRMLNRSHWNSDVVYGRLVATMVWPIVNAMSGLQNGYEATKKAINGGQTVKTPSKVVSFTLKIQNKRSSAIAIDDKINFVLANPDRNGFYYGEVNGSPYTGIYNRFEIKPLGTGNKKSITIPANGEKSFTLKPSSECEVFNPDKSLYGNVLNGFGGRNLVTKEFVNSESWNSSRGKTNVMLYVDGDSNIVVPECMDSNVVFEDGKTYTLIIK